MQFCITYITRMTCMHRVKVFMQKNCVWYNARMQNAATLPTHVPTLQQLVLEQQHMIETLKEQLRLMLRRQFGPRHEAVNLDQMGLFAKPDDTNTVIEVTERVSEPCSRELEPKAHTEHKHVDVHPILTHFEG